MSLIQVYKKNWVKGVDSSGDDNIIHRKYSGALRFGLDDIVAPGIWVASHVQREGPVSSIKQIKFSGKIYDEDVLDVSGNFSVGRKNYVFSRDGEKVLEVKGVEFGKYSEAPNIFAAGDILHCYNSFVDSRNLKKFLSSLGVSDDGKFPNTYALALSAPALLDFGKSRNIIGIHTSQSFDVHEPFRVDSPISVLVGSEKIKKGRDGGSLNYCDQQWVQDGRVKASGKASVVPLDTSKFPAINPLVAWFVDFKYAVDKIIVPR